MKFSSGEKKLLAICVVAIALPLTVGVYLNRINATPIVNIPAPPQAPKPNGFDLYVAAATAMTRVKPEVGPASDTSPPSDAKARAQRYSLARKTAWLNQNQKAFVLFDRALQTPSLAPPWRSFNAPFPSYAKLRQLARDKSVESDARWMRGDYEDALQSNLDTVQMGHDMRRGGVLITHLVGIAISAIGRGNTGDTIERLNAAQCKSAARRLENLLATRWNLDQVLTEEKWAGQAGMMEIFGTKNWRSADQSLLGGEDEKPSLAERWRRSTISKQQIINDIGADYDRQIANAKLPYAQKGAPEPNYNDPFVSPELSRVRVNDARDLMGDNTLMLQLALRAYQLENGVYPPALKSLVPNYIKAVPADPFGGGEALRYKLNGKTYALWSIGPDGVDDGGKPIPPKSAPHPSFPNERPRGPRSFTDFDGKGDVVAGVNTG